MMSIYLDMVSSTKKGARNMARTSYELLKNAGKGKIEFKVRKLLTRLGRLCDTSVSDVSGFGK
jgi:hypothetical protein